MRFLNLLLAASLTLSPMVATPALAAPPTSRVDTEAEVMTLLGDIVAWSAPLNQLMTDSNALGLEMIDVVAQAMEPGRKGTEGRAWINAWLARADSELARQRAALAAVPPMSPDLDRRYRSLGPTAVRQVEGFQTLPSVVRGVIDDTDSLLNRLRPLLIKAASGDTKAKLEIARHTLSGTRLAIRNENALLDLAIVMSNRPDHPQVALSKSAKASNEASMLALEYLERQLNGETPDPVAAGKAMQAKVALSRAEAANAWPNARKIKAEIGGSLPAGPLKTSFNTALDTYEESGQVETRIADSLGAIADRLASGNSVVDPDGDAWSAIEPLVERRTAIQARRVSLFQQR
ncbi:MAG: hypothetical protein Q7T61_09480 [Caulobacter sp.]|nr:hypothetical protein [Caulobacter sp.]